MRKKDEIDANLAAMMDPGAGVLLDKSKIDSPFNIKDKEEEAPEEETEFKEDKDPKGKTVWIHTPTFEDQYKRFPQTTRMVGPVVAVFDVANPEQLKELNNLLAKQQPEDSPSIILASRKENFHEGKWLMLLEYFRVEYKQLITTS